MKTSDVMLIGLILSLLASSCLVLCVMRVHDRKRTDAMEIRLQKLESNQKLAQ